MNKKELKQNGVVVCGSGYYDAETDAYFPFPQNYFK